MTSDEPSVPPIVLMPVVETPVVLTIAGFDPSGGAGIIADIRAFTFFGCVPVAAVTSLTFQNSTAMSGTAHQTVETVREQVKSLLAENSIAGVKTGMLPTREIVREVVRLFRETNLPAPVIDPVMRSSSGYDLIEEDAWDVLLSDLMPLARVITPNIPEAERITGQQISDEEGMRRAANQIREMGVRAVLIKGGHLYSSAGGPGSPEGQPGRGGGSERVNGGTDAGEPEAAMPALQAIDVLDDEGEVTVFRGHWIEGPTVRGTGCMLSAAIAAGLAQNMDMGKAVCTAKDFVAEVLNQRRKH